MSCDVRSCEELSSVVPCNGIEYYELKTPLFSKQLQYYSNTTLYYKVLVCTIQSTTPVLLCTTKYYSTTTKYYSSTALYYKVLLQYYCVLQGTTPVLQRTRLYYKVLLRTTKYYSATTKYNSSTTKYYSSTTKYYKVLLRYYFETSFTMPGAARVTLQLHQILRLPRKMNLMIDPPRIWIVIYNARSSKSHPPTSPNTAPAISDPRHIWNVI